jgi:hypothetical protein
MDLAKLTTLTAVSQNIKSLKGLEFAINLTKINLTDNWIKDLTPLKNLKKLTSVDFEYNQLSTICPIAGNWSQLEILILSDNTIKDISCLSNLKNLERIFLSDNMITDIRALDGFAGTYVEITDNLVEDIEVATTWKNIEEFYLANNPIREEFFGLIMALRRFETIVDLENAYDIQVFVGTDPVEFKMPPFQTQGTTLVEFRPIFEKLGLAIRYDGKSKTITGTKSGINLQLKIGSKQATINGKVKSLSVAPQVRGNVTMVPLRLVAEATGLAVSWNDYNRWITIATEVQQIEIFMQQHNLHYNTFNIPAYYSFYSQNYPDYDLIEGQLNDFYYEMETAETNFYLEYKSHEITTLTSNQAEVTVQYDLNVYDASTSGEETSSLIIQYVLQKNKNGRWQIVEEQQVETM